MLLCSCRLCYVLCVCVCLCASACLGLVPTVMHHVQAEIAAYNRSRHRMVLVRVCLRPCAFGPNAMHGQSMRYPKKKSTGSRDMGTSLCLGEAHTLAPSNRIPRSLLYILDLMTAIQHAACYHHTSNTASRRTPRDIVCAVIYIYIYIIL